MNFSMPYTEAFLMELLRITSVTSFAIPRIASENFDFQGYCIPKGASVYPSLYTTHYDPEIFPEPEKFQPERFLSQDGKTVQKNNSLIPFCVGRRACPGESFARDELFLFITCLVQNFHIGAEPGKPKPPLATKLGQGTLEPEHFLLSMNCRE